MRKSRQALTTSALVIAAALFVAINVLADTALRNMRLDLTENGLYTLSEGSRNILRTLEEPIRLRFFYSEHLASEVPQLRIYAARVRELLEQYAALADGRITLEVIDPEPFSDAEDRAVSAGVQGVPLDGGRGLFYFGLVGTNSVDDQEVIPFFQQQKEQFLEYDLTRLVYGLTLPEKPRVALITGLPLQFGPGGLQAAMRGQSQPFAIMGQLRQFFEVETLNGEVDEIDEDIGVLVLAHPTNLSDKTRYAIDQFVMRGGRLVALVDPYSETAAAIPDPSTGMPGFGAPQGSMLPELFESWGIAMEPDSFVADLGLAQRVRTSLGGSQNIIDYLPWLGIGAENLDDQDLVTAELGRVNLASVGALKRANGATTTFSPLITSSDKAMLAPVSELSGPPDPTGMLERFEPSGERYVLGARVTGTVKSAFPDGPPAADKAQDSAAAEAEPKADEEKAEPRPHLAESVEPVNIIVIADADLLDDRFWVQTQDLFGQRVVIPTAANGDLVLNAVEVLSGSNDLISLRSRSRSERPFEVIEEMRREAEQKFRSRERRLEESLEETERKITELQSKKSGGDVLLSAEEQEAIDEFRQQLVQTRQELREVQRDLNREIEGVETMIRFANIGLIPILIGVIALVVTALGRSRRRRRVAEG